MLPSSQSSNDPPKEGIFLINKKSPLVVKYHAQDQLATVVISGRSKNQKIHTKCRPMQPPPSAEQEWDWVLSQLTFATSLLTCSLALEKAIQSLRPGAWTLATTREMRCVSFRALLLLSGLGPQDQAASWGAGTQGVCAHGHGGEQELQLGAMCFSLDT